MGLGLPNYIAGGLASLQLAGMLISTASMVHIATRAISFPRKAFTEKPKVTRTIKIAAPRSKGPPIEV